MDILPSLRPDSLFVIQVSNFEPNIPVLIAELALRGAVTVLDGGNCFQAYHIAKLIRHKSLEVNRICKHIFIRRAFTAYQMVSLLENSPGLRQPHIILDLLSTFQDDQVKPQEADRLLTLCLKEIERLRMVAPVLVTLSNHLADDKAFLVETVYSQADQVFLPERETLLQEKQLALF